MEYLYECAKGHRVYEDLPMTSVKPDWKKCPDCPEKAWRVFTFQTAANVGVFQSYVEQNLPGGPVEITSAQQRDRLCAKHDVTYDTYSNLEHKRGKVSGVESLTVDEAMTQYKKDKGEWL